MIIVISKNNNIYKALKELNHLQLIKIIVRIPILNPKIIKILKLNEITKNPKNLQIKFKMDLRNKI